MGDKQAFESLNTLTTGQSDLYSAEEWISLTGEAILPEQHTGSRKEFSEKSYARPKEETIILVIPKNYHPRNARHNSFSSTRAYRIPRQDLRPR